MGVAFAAGWFRGEVSTHLPGHVPRNIGPSETPQRSERAHNPQAERSIVPAGQEEVVIVEEEDPPAAAKGTLDGAIKQGELVCYAIEESSWPCAPHVEMPVLKKEIKRSVVVACGEDAEAA